MLADLDRQSVRQLPAFRAASIYTAFAFLCAFIAICSCRASAAQTQLDAQNQQHCDDDSTASDDGGDDAKSQANDDAQTVKAADSDDDGAATAASSDAGKDSGDKQKADADKDDNSAGCSSDDNDADDDSSSDDSDKDAAVDPEDRASLLTLFDYYTDSEHYVNVTTTSIAAAPFEGFVATLRRDWMQARDTNTQQAAEITTLAFNRDFSELWGVGGGFGTARGLRSNDIIGSFQTHFDDDGFSATATIARDMLLASAATVASNIRQTDLGLSLSYDLSEAISADAEAHRRYYSDGNRADEISFSPDYKFPLLGGKFALGYRFSYSAYAVNPEDGYWAPSSALSDGIALGWSFDRQAYYGRAELGASYDQVREEGKLANGPSSGPGGSGEFTFGFRPAQGTEVETYWTGNGSASWNSMNVGLVLRYFF